jgi:preprotein translocase subunit SecE
MLEKLRQYLRETALEMKRVSWPTIAELKESTTVVIITVAIVTVFVFVVDTILDQTIRRLIMMG